jgi:large subunit ribosomal protein L25
MLRRYRSVGDWKTLARAPASTAGTPSKGSGSRVGALRPPRPPCPTQKKDIMANQEIVTATPREGKFNKNAARRVRVTGKIPAVVYGAKEDAIAVTVDPKQIQRILYSETGHNSIFDLEISGSTAKAKAMIVDWQYEPIKGHLLHIDLKRIAMDKAIRVEVPIQCVGIPVGVRVSGGILDQVLREVEIECLPGDIPGHIDVDVSELTFGAVLRVSDLPHTGSLKFLTDENAVVAHVVSIREEVVATPDAVAAVVGTPVEPEVVKKGKQDLPEAEAPKGGKK